MTAVPSVVLFDVNETLSDMSPLADAFEAVGLSAEGHRCGSRRCCATGSR
ncbi:hypothetical protein [Nesterenkonia pannonica]|nr:hypothetical protein [Nesterenkonia pannonica]